MRIKTLLKTIVATTLMSFGAGNANAAVIETVGATDYSSAFATREKADQVIDGDGALHYTFINHNGGTTTNWFNFILEANDGAGKYIDMRADNYGWGDLTSGVVYSNTYDWTKFNSDLDGATVDMYIYKKGTHVLVESNITTKANTLLKYQAFYPNVSTTKLNCYLMVEKCYLEITKREATTLPTHVDIADEVVGYLDYSSNYLGTSSAERKLADGQGYEIKFKNLNNGATDNYKNWILRCFNNDATWSLNFNLRADNAALFANGASWDETPTVSFNIACDYNWDTFAADMNGATVDLKVWRNNGTVNVNALTTTAAGATYNYTYSQDGITSSNCTIAMSQEAAILDILSWTDYDYVADGISTVQSSSASNTGVYSLAGQKLSAPVKGVNIINGKKYIVK